MQEWTEDISMMQQTVLISAVRGPDGIVKYSDVKNLIRWFRRCVLISATDGEVLTNPYSLSGGSFTGPSYSGGTKGGWEYPMCRVVDGYIRSLDAIPHHFQLHLMHAIEIIGYKHPDDRIRAWWYSVYLRLVADMHLSPETEETLDHRLGDNREQWLAHSDPATTD